MGFALCVLCRYSPLNVLFNLTHIFNQLQFYMLEIWFRYSAVPWNVIMHSLALRCVQSNETKGIGRIHNYDKPIRYSQINNYYSLRFFSSLFCVLIRHRWILWDKLINLFMTTAINFCFLDCRLNQHFNEVKHYSSVYRTLSYSTQTRDRKQRGWLLFSVLLCEKFSTFV